MDKKNKGVLDVTPEGKQPTIGDVWRLSVEILDRLEVVERQQEAHVTAFAVNDLNLPDFDGHRKSHAKLTKSEEILESYKQDATKNIISLAIVFVLGIFSSGILHKITELLK